MDYPSANIAGSVQQSVNVSTSAASIGALDPGIYDVWSDVNVYLRCAGSKTDAETVTANNGYIVYAAKVVSIKVTLAGSYLGAIAGGAGKLSIHKVGN